MIAQPAPVSTSALHLAVEPGRDWTTLFLRGEVDLASIGRLEAAVDELRDSGFDALRIDLRAVSFADTTLVHLLLRLAEDRRKGCVWRFV